MTDLKLKIKKVASFNPVTKQKGFASRVITNGKSVYTDIAAEATRRTTLHTAEAQLAASLLVEEVANKLKQGYIVDMGPMGTFYPSCASKWTAKAEEQTLAAIQPYVNFHPSKEIEVAVKSATIGWVKADGETEDETTESTDAGSTNTDTGGSGSGNADGGIG